MSILPRRVRRVWMSLQESKKRSANRYVYLAKAHSMSMDVATRESKKRSAYRYVYLAKARSMSMDVATAESIDKKIRRQLVAARVRVVLEGDEIYVED